MRILHVIGSMELGGAQAVMVGLAEEAQRRGHECQVVHLRTENDYVERLAAANIASNSLGCDAPFRLRSLPALRRARRDLARQVAAFEPHVIHAHLFGAMLVLMEHRRRGSAPVVQTIHDNLPWFRPRGFRARMQLAVTRRFAREIARYSVAISREVQADALRALRGVEAARVPVILNYVESVPDVPAAQRVRTASSSPLRVGLVSRLVVEKKGLDVAVAALAKLPEARLIVVGDGPGRKTLERLAARQGVAERLELRGMRRDVYAQMREMDVLWVPSRWEGFGLVAAEAAMMGLPVVASNVGGLAEVVRDGETGRLVPAGDAIALAEATRNLVADHETYQRLSTEALAHAEATFTRERAATEYLDLYTKAAAASGQS